MKDSVRVLKRKIQRAIPVEKNHLRDMVFTVHVARPRRSRWFRVDDEVVQALQAGEVPTVFRDLLALESCCSNLDLEIGAYLGGALGQGNQLHLLINVVSGSRSARIDTSHREVQRQLEPTLSQATSEPSLPPAAPLAVASANEGEAQATTGSIESQPPRGSPSADSMALSGYAATPSMGLTVELFSSMGLESVEEEAMSREKLQQIVFAMKKTIAELQAKLAAKDRAHQEELKTLAAGHQAALAAKEETVAALRSDLECMEAAHRSLQATADAADREMKRNQVAAEKRRRKMHNLIMELRGNIQVFARIRPLLGDDVCCVGKASPSVVCIDDQTLRVQSSACGCNAEMEERDFKFDKVIPEGCSQRDMFAEVADFVQSAIDGHHVCLLSYGQTGSGKTHTMHGDDDGDMRGSVPRAIEQILAQFEQLKSAGWEYTAKLLATEVHNEKLTDLLLAGDKRSFLVRLN